MLPVAYIQISFTEDIMAQNWWCFWPVKAEDAILIDLEMTIKIKQNDPKSNTKGCYRGGETIRVFPSQ